jgi:hypothetical protein
MVTDITLAYGYQLELLDELPNAPSTRRYYVPPQGTGGKDGILLRVVPVAADGFRFAVMNGRYVCCQNAPTPIEEVGSAALIVRMKSSQSSRTAVAEAEP